MLAARLTLRTASYRRAFTTTSVLLSGHNKWSKIKESKGANDALKSAVYSRVNREIAIAARTGGSVDPEQNAALATVLKKAKQSGVPKDNIENALKRASGAKEKGHQQVTYEAMAFGTVGVIIECVTDNINRTHKALQSILATHNARYAPVGFLFQRKGRVVVSLDETPDLDARLEDLVDAALQAGAEDFEQDDPENGAVEIEFVCLPSSLTVLTDAVTKSGLIRELVSSELIYSPAEPGEPPDEETENKVASLVEAVEENDDTLHVWTTLDG